MKLRVLYLDKTSVPYIMTECGNAFPWLDFKGKTNSGIEFKLRDSVNKTIIYRSSSAQPYKIPIIRHSVSDGNKPRIRAFKIFNFSSF